MGYGSTITFRQVSKSGYPATIEFNFPGIWNNIRVVKFGN